MNFTNNNLNKNSSFSIPGQHGQPHPRAGNAQRFLRTQIARHFSQQAQAESDFFQRHLSTSRKFFCGCIKRLCVCVCVCFHSLTRSDIGTPSHFPWCASCAICSWYWCCLPFLPSVLCYSLTVSFRGKNKLENLAVRYSYTHTHTHTHTHTQITATAAAPAQRPQQPRLHFQHPWLQR